MTVFLRMLEDSDKERGLREAVQSFRCASDSRRVFLVSPKEIRAIPGSPFAYWANEQIIQSFSKFPSFESEQRTARQGLATADDFRFLRTWWECGETSSENPNNQWRLIAKGGKYSPFYSDVYLAVKWGSSGGELDAFSGSVIRNREFYSRPGLVWPRRTKSKLSMRILPEGCIFADKGPAIFVEEDDSKKILATLSICQSKSFYRLVQLQLAAADARAGGAAHSFEVGVIKRCPVPHLTSVQIEELAALARTAWSIRRTLDTTSETSHAFLLPVFLRGRIDAYDEIVIEDKISKLQVVIDEISRSLYQFYQDDRNNVLDFFSSIVRESCDDTQPEDDEDDDVSASPIDQTDDLLSWCLGVAFGHFDWRLATGEREAPPEPDPFDPLPAKSPGMLPDGAAPFHDHSGILVDDQGHRHDLPRLIEEVLARVQADAPGDVRRWLRRDFFPLHLKRYSKSRRKAPIYWPLSTPSGSYTLWLYYPSLTSQTLYAAVHDFVEPKLEQVGRDAATLRDQGAARSRDDELALEALQALELELIELRDELLKIAPTYRPNHDDGVQIIAAPIWRLFRHRPWQTILKDTWSRLEKGDYDWAHLAMAYRPAQVREKCRSDRSLAIAHDLEHLYELPPEAADKPKRGRRKKG